MSLYCDLCFPKQTFSLTEKISKPLSARLSSRAFFSSVDFACYCSYQRRLRLRGGGASLASAGGGVYVQSSIT